MGTTNSRTPRRRWRTLTALAAAALIGTAFGGLTAQSASARSAATGSYQAGSHQTGADSHQAATKRLCSTPAAAGQMACLALVRTDVAGVRADALGPAATPAGYGPGDLRSAYKLTANGAATETIAIVDAYDDPNAESDLAAYRTQYGLPACTTANGCFRKVNQSGGTSYPPGNSGWAGEISLDLDMVSAIAPGAHILLVEANSASMGDLGAAENEAVALGAKFVSNSWGGGESGSDLSYDKAYFNHPGVAITVSSGDSSYGVEYPAASQYVTAVGGTSLRTATNARGWSETVWSGSGSGCSAYDPKPSWQTDTGCARRTVADVAAVADPATGVAVYDTYGASGWQVYGGTSAAAPIIASVYALAGVPAGGDRPAKYPYQHSYSLFDVTSGSNGSCSPAYLCTGVVGYDGPTGLGTPNGVWGFAPTSTVSVVSLKAHANGDYVTSDSGGASPLIANRTTIGPSEQFDLVANPDGSVSLRAHANAKVVTADNAGASPLIANRTAIGPWEEFDLVHNADGSVSLRAHANGDIVTADNAGASPLIANRTAIGPWEEFDLITASGPSPVSLRAHANSDYVTADNAGASPLIANRTAIGPWEQFDLINNADGSVSLRAHANNDIVSADNTGASPLIANRTAIGQWEEFDVVYNADGSTSLHAHANGDIVSADNAGASPLIANRLSIGQWEEFDLLYDS
ncbi:hypothetical protein GCM10009839_55160 [Catenulispora yoronensis]|uniref:Peptidase S53 domain-containing protein n=1 Tax=Catenulispora yoronensis TaxID=450799 RepID=A0ABN2UYK5_9ACTN